MDIRKLRVEAQCGVRKALMAVGEDAVARIRDRLPQELRGTSLDASIAYRISADGQSLTIGAADDAATDIEYGTFVLPPQPFFNPALAGLKESAEQAVLSATSQAIEKVLK